MSVLKLFFQKLENVNTKKRTRKTKTRLENLLRIANRQIKVNMDKFAKTKHTVSSVFEVAYDSKYRGADKSLARPGRKQATATEEFDFLIFYL
jgi:hypothetical protein